MVPFIGQIQTFGFSYVPREWAVCDGQELAISSHTALFSLLGTTFGGDGRRTFALPDLRGRSIVGVGQGLGLDPRALGERGGINRVTLTTDQMPSHNHTLNAYNGQGDTRAPGGDLNATSSTGDFNYKGGNTTPNATMLSASIGNAGGGQPIEIDTPYLGLNICIALLGDYPARS